MIYIGTVAVFVFIFGGFDVNYVLCQVCGGGLIFGAFFMATDYVTSRSLQWDRLYSVLF